MAITRLSTNRLLSTRYMPFASISGTTGTPTTGNYTDSNGDTWDYWQWDASGSVTVSQAGWARVLIVGGGARGDGVNVGDSGNAYDAYEYLNIGTITVTVGGGGGGTNTGGGPSLLVGYGGVGGGRSTTGNQSGGGAGALTSDINGASTTYATSGTSQRGAGGASSAVAGRIVIALKR